MKKQTIEKKLGHFKNYTGVSGETVYQSQTNPCRSVKVYDKRNGGDNKLAIPCFRSDGVELVAFHAKSVKSLVEFLEGAPCISIT
jgi:hypothetical protein